MLYFPAGSVPDEVFHFKNACMYSNIISGQDKFTVRDVDYAFLTEGSALTKSIFLIPNRRFSSSRNALLFKIATVVLPFAGIALLSLPTITGMASSSRSVVYTQDGRVGYCYTLSELLSSPLNTAQLFLTTMRVNLWFYLSSAVGGILGWFQGTIGLSVNATDFLLLLVLVSSLQSNDDSQVLRLSHRVYLGCIFLLGVGALVLVFAIAWTLNTSSVIEGVQGRYFLPIVLFALLAIRPEMIKIQSNVTMPLIMILTSFSYLYLGYIAACVLCL